jgi:hypothetical protein
MSDNFLRLRNYRTYLHDGKGYVEYKCSEKGQVMVALLLGMEPKAIENQSDFLDVDSIILKMAEHIKKKNKEEKVNAAEAAGGK